MLPGLRGIIGFPVASDSRSLTATGTTSFVVPKYHTLTVDVYGAGGGADNGGDGGASSFGSSTPVVGDGGKSGWYGVIAFIPYGGGYIPVYGGRAGANGTASGGDTNTTGGGSPGGSGSGPGGAGGRATKAFTYGTSGAPVPGSTITVTVGAKGGNGTDGKVLINWT